MPSSPPHQSARHSAPHGVLSGTANLHCEDEDSNRDSEGSPEESDEDSDDYDSIDSDNDSSRRKDSNIKVDGSKTISSDPRKNGKAPAKSFDEAADEESDMSGSESCSATKEISGNKNESKLELSCKSSNKKLSNSQVENRNSQRQIVKEDSSKSSSESGSEVRNSRMLVISLPHFFQQILCHNCMCFIM